MFTCDSPVHLPHFFTMWACQWCIFFKDRSTSVIPSAARLMDRKTSKHRRNDAKTGGCVCVTYRDESAFGEKIHVDALHTAHTSAPWAQTGARTQTQHTHTALWHQWYKVKEVKVPEDKRMCMPPARFRKISVGIGQHVGTAVSVIFV